jgi:hypothetical protein
MNDAPARHTLGVAIGLQVVISAGDGLAMIALAAGFGVCAAILQPGLGAIVPRLAGFSYLRADTEAGTLVLIVGVLVAFANLAVVAEVDFAEHVLGSGPGGCSVLSLRGQQGWSSGRCSAAGFRNGC